MPILTVVCLLHDSVLWLHAFLHLPGCHSGELLPLICGMQPCQQDNRHAAKGAMALGTLLYLQPSTLANKTLVLWSIWMAFCNADTLSAVGTVCQQHTLCNSRGLSHSACNQTKPKCLE